MKASEFEFTIFMDLDGVMADLEKYVREELGYNLSGDSDQDEPIWNELHEMQRNGFEMFNKFDKMPDADRLWDYVKKYRPHILTATGPVEKPVRRQKVEWVHKNLSNFNEILTTRRGRDKKKYAAPTHILIDDRPTSINPWREAGGIGILHVNAEDSINQLRSIGVK